MNRKPYASDYNSTTTVKGSTVTIVLDLSKDGKLAKSGNSTIVASAQGGLDVGGKFVSYSLNAFVSLTDAQKAAQDKATFDAVVNAEIAKRGLVAA